MAYSKIRPLCDEILCENMEKLAMDMGIVSHIHDELYEIVAITSKANVFVAGESFKLKDTFCREVIEKQKTIALVELHGVPGLCMHPLYDGMPLEAYISSPIYNQGKIWGTLNFSSMKVRPEPFTDSEISLVKSAAERITLSI